MWTYHQLTCAVWAAHVLTIDGQNDEEVRSSWSHLALGGVVGFADLELAMAALEQVGLVKRESNRLIPDRRLAELVAVPDESAARLLYELILHHSPPLWARTAIREGVIATELIPDRDRAAFESVILDPARREALLLSIGQQFDESEMAALGSLGEEEVVARCKMQLLEIGAIEAASQVRQVSLISDLLGYDVTAPRVDGSMRRLEVKATRSLGSEVTVFLSRNEANVGIRDPDWSLVVVGVTSGLEIASVIGWLDGKLLKDLLPTDAPKSNWQVTKLRIGRAVLCEGIPSALPKLV